MNVQSNGSRPPHISALDCLPLALLLFAFWVVLSGKFDGFHIGAGAAGSLVIALVSRKLYALEPSIGPPGRHPFAGVPWMRIVSYSVWLGGQIFVSSLQVTRLVLAPRLRIQPRLIRFRYPLPHAMARATLANSITLTPGTVTIEVEGDEYLVHALTPDSARSLAGEGGMKERVARLFRPA